MKIICLMDGCVEKHCVYKNPVLLNHTPLEFSISEQWVNSSNADSVLCYVHAGSDGQTLCCGKFYNYDNVERGD